MSNSTCTKQKLRDGCTVRTPMQTAMGRNGNGWIYTIILCCVLFLLCCFCCKECCFCIFLHWLFSPEDDIAQDNFCFAYYWLAWASLPVISHMSYSSRSTISIHYISTCIHIFEKQKVHYKTCFAIAPRRWRIMLCRWERTPRNRALSAN